MVEVVVVGGGAMGSAAAWQLARRGADVVLLEQFGPGHGRGSSHGSSRIVRLSYDDPFYVDLAAAAYQQWDELEADSGEQLLTWTGVVDHGEQSTVDAMTQLLSTRVTPRTCSIRPKPLLAGQACGSTGRCCSIPAVAGPTRTGPLPL